MNPATPVTSQVRGLIVRRSWTASYVVHFSSGPPKSFCPGASLARLSICAHG